MIEFDLKEGKFNEDIKPIQPKLLPKDYKKYAFELFNYTDENGIIIDFNKFKLFVRSHFTFGFDFDKPYDKLDLERKIIRKYAEKFCNKIYDILWKFDDVNRKYGYNLEKSTICYPIIPFNCVMRESMSRDSFFICKNFNQAFMRSPGASKMDLLSTIDILYITRIKLEKDTRILNLENGIMYIVGTLGKLKKIYKTEIELGMLHERLHKKKNNILNIEILEYDFCQDEDHPYSKDGNFSFIL